MLQIVSWSWQLCKRNLKLWPGTTISHRSKQETCQAAIVLWSKLCILESQMDNTGVHRVKFQAVVSPPPLYKSNSQDESNMRKAEGSSDYSFRSGRYGLQAADGASNWTGLSGHGTVVFKGDIEGTASVGDESNHGGNHADVYNPAPVNWLLGQARRTQSVHISKEMVRLFFFCSYLDICVLLLHMCLLVTKVWVRVIIS